MISQTKTSRVNRTTAAASAPDVSALSSIF